MIVGSKKIKRYLPGLVAKLVLGLLLLIGTNVSAQFINRLEYFFDTDPGVGNGTPLTIPVPADSITFNTTINTTGLSGGNHVLFIRSRLANGKWSLYEPREFHIRSRIIAAEYFFDTDPGVGLATSLPVASLTEPATHTATLPTTGLTGGNHVLFIRTKDNAGRWSLYEPREFHIRSRISAAEYFFDTDPGVGLATALPVAALVEPATYINTISATGLTGGNHVLFIRTRDEQGRWSLYEPREFYVRANIIAAEYFIDTDPGVGLATPLPVGPVSDTVSFSNTIPTGMLTVGAHFVFFRTKDVKGVWSLYEPKQFNVSDNPLPVIWLSFDAERKGSDALLTWVTASEESCSHFEIERMTGDDANATSFIKIGEVNGNGTTNVQHEYLFIDYNVQHNGTCYYRIKQVDFNGDFIYSRTLAVDFNTTNPVIKLYPNPSSEYFTLDVAGDNKTILSLEIVNNRGQLVATHNTFSFPFSFGDNLIAGSYVVTLTTVKGTMQFKVIKAR